MVLSRFSNFLEEILDFTFIRFLKSRTNFYSVMYNCYAGRWDKKKRRGCERHSDITRTCYGERFSKKNSVGQKTRKRKIKYRSERVSRFIRVSKVFSAARRNFSPGRLRSCLLKAAKGAIIFHLRYRAHPTSRARVEETDAAASSREWKITGDNKFYEEAPFPAESPFRPMIRFADKIADKDGDC